MNILNNIKQKIKRIPCSFWILLTIMVVGIFLRTYNFSDWLRFNSDQARDASIVREMTEENAFPLLGPVAGGTNFKIGPITYYFSYISTKIFGVSPDKMAYPDLLWGILTIPLLFFLFREFFKKNTSLILTGLYSVSYFAIEYSRFSWNPNSSQFFCPLFLFSFLKILNSQGKKRVVWIILSGFSLGVLIQLHTLLLFGMPLVFLVLSIYFIKKKKIQILGFLFILLIATSLNIPQIIHEIQTRGGNSYQLVQAIISKDENQPPIWKNALNMTTCQIQVNAKILFPLNKQEDCSQIFSKKYLKNINKENKTSSAWFVYLIKFTLITIFSLGGYLLWFLFWKKEREESKRNFLLLFGFFHFLLFLIFIPFGGEISLRYFIPLAFIPFALIGFWIESLKDKVKKIKSFKSFIFLILILLFSYNIFFCFKTFKNFSNHIPGNLINGSLLQVREMSDYILNESGSEKTVQIRSGRKEKRFFNRVSYFINEKYATINIESETDISSVFPLFIAIDKHHKKYKQGKAGEYGKVEGYKEFGKITIFKVTPKNTKYYLK